MILFSAMSFFFSVYGVLSEKIKIHTSPVQNHYQVIRYLNPLNRLSAVGDCAVNSALHP
jgi:hypothetical protein